MCKKKTLAQAQGEHVSPRYASAGGVFSIKSLRIPAVYGMVSFKPSECYHSIGHMSSSFFIEMEKAGQIKYDIYDTKFTKNETKALTFDLKKDTV